jgi:hypothetical protein
MTAALSDPKMREAAASVLPTTKRSRGRPRKMKTELEGGLAVLAALREASRGDAIEDEIAQAVARRVIRRQKVEARPQ